MAKQVGIMPLEGTLGEYTFIKTQDGYMVRTRGGVSAERIATDPDFQRTRENNAEFSRACQGGKVLRVSLRKLIRNKRKCGNPAFAPFTQ